MIAVLRWSVALAVIIGVFTVDRAAAVDVRPSLENAITRALQKPLAVNFQQTPLTEVVQRLASEAGLPFRIDADSLRDEDVPLTHPVTFATETQPIAETLDEILRPLQLDYDPRGEALLITTWNQKHELMTQRFFDVSQLVQLIHPRLQSIEVRPINPDGFGSSEKKDAVADHGFGGSNSKSQRANFRTLLNDAQHRFPAEYALMLIVMDHTSGEWQDESGVGGMFHPSPGRILLQQIEPVHRESYVVLSNLERFLRDPKTLPRLRLNDDDEDRHRRAALDRILDTVSEAPAGTLSLPQWIDENLLAQGILIRIDHDSLQEEEIDLKEVSVSLRPGVTRRQLLKDALDAAQLSLRYLNKHFTLVSVATADEVQDTMLFDVSDLAEAGDMDWLTEYVTSATSGEWEHDSDVGGRMSACGISGLLFVRQTEQVLQEVVERLDALRQPLEVPAKPLAPQRKRSLYTLPDVATATDLQTVLPKLVDLPDAPWPEDAIQRVGTVLIVQQTEFVQRRIETVIAAIRAAHGVKTTETHTPP